jgi:AcrR family transcriptional regulator
VGLRESKKLRMREEIAGQAMRLFATRGFDKVTVAEVAAAAGVSEKTVFNYFPTKEDLFFDEVPEREAAMLDAIRNRAPGVSVLDALRGLQSAQCNRMASPGFATFARIIEESPALKAKELEVMAHMAQVLTDAIAAELQLDERDAPIVAGLIVSVQRQFFRLARQQALAGKHGDAAARKLRAGIDRAFDILANGIGTFENGGFENGGHAGTTGRPPKTHR